VGRSVSSRSPTQPAGPRSLFFSITGWMPGSREGYLARRIGWRIGGVGLQRKTAGAWPLYNSGNVGLYRHACTQFISNVFHVIVSHLHQADCFEVEWFLVWLARCRRRTWPCRGLWRQTSGEQTELLCSSVPMISLPRTSVCYGRRRSDSRALDHLRLAPIRIGRGIRQSQLIPAVPERPAHLTGTPGGGFRTGEP